MEKIQITFDATKLLKGILEVDDTMHSRLRDKIEQRLIDDITEDIRDKFFGQNWRGEIEIHNHINDELNKKVEEIAKEILKKFYDSYRWGKKDITILKKLKELLGE